MNIIAVHAEVSGPSVFLGDAGDRKGQEAAGVMGPPGCLFPSECASGVNETAFTLAHT